MNSQSLLEAEEAVTFLMNSCYRGVRADKVTERQCWCQETHSEYEITKSMAKLEKSGVFTAKASSLWVHVEELQCGPAGPLEWRLCHGWQ